MADLPPPEYKFVPQVEWHKKELPTPRLRWTPDKERPGQYLLQQLWEVKKSPTLRWTEWRSIPIEEGNEQK